MESEVSSRTQSSSEDNANIIAQIPDTTITYTSYKEEQDKDPDIQWIKQLILQHRDDN